MVPNWITIENGPILNPPSSDNSVLFDFSTPSPFSIFLSPGEYLFECWGASGGNSSILHTGNPTTVTQGFGGRGGFSRGKISLHSTTRAFIYVGEMGYVVAGQNIDLPGTFGGGGGIYAPGIYGNGVKGGGSSDIRLFIDDLFHRIIVGGGGGGASGGESANIQMPGGHGGGLIGGNGYNDFNISYYTSGGSQTPDGSSITCCGLPGDIGIFGQGGRTVNTGGTNYGGGGGGGWFGGSGGGHRVAGGGGSSFVFNSSSIVNSSYAFDNSHYLKDTEIISGEFMIPSPSLNLSVHNEIYGRTGHGCVVITNLHYLSHVFDHESCFHATILTSSLFWTLFCLFIIDNQFDESH